MAVRTSVAYSPSTLKLEAQVKALEDKVNALEKEIENLREDLDCQTIRINYWNVRDVI